MNTPPHLHYHTDCDFFAGCENMIANFLGDERIFQDFKVSFSYRRSERYEAGLRSRVSADIRGECYPILAGNALPKLVAVMPKPVRIAVKTAGYLLLLRYWVLAWNVLVLYRAWRNRGIDLLHINNGNYPGALSCQSAAVAARMAGVAQVVMVVNNIPIPHRYRRWPLDFLLDYLVAKSVTMFVTGSISAADALQAELKLPNKKISVLHNGIAVRQVSETRSQTRFRLGMGEDILIFGMVAILEWRKGHRVLLNAIAELRKLISLERMPVFLIEGEGVEHPALERIVEQLAIGQWVRFVGVERNIFDFMQALDVIVLPSIAHEDFPNVVLEAMSLGKPVIASRIAGTPEQIEDGVTGCLVEPGDCSALAFKLREFVDNRARIDIMGDQARRRFEKKFTANEAVSRYLDLYRVLLKGSKN